MKQNTTYKQTELGLIPEDWEVKKLGEILKEYSLGGNYENNSEESGIPLIKTKYILFDAYLINTQLF